MIVVDAPTKSLEVMLGAAAASRSSPDLLTSPRCPSRQGERRIDETLIRCRSLLHLDNCNRRLGWTSGHTYAPHGGRVRQGGPTCACLLLR